MTRLAILVSLLVANFSFAGIHGPTDDRQFSVNHPDQNLTVLSKSVAAMLPKNPDKIYKLKTLQDIKGMCSEQAFASSPSLPSCTGVLIAKNKILTAGHCIISEKKCKEYVWSFNYTDPKIGNTFSDPEIYNCKRLVERKKNYLTHEDYAVIELDRDVQDRTPVIARISGEIEKNAPLAVIGHPAGLPSIIANNGLVLENNHDLLYFATNLDTTAGNSGAPVFNLKTYELEGILIRGGTDFDTDFDSEDMCRTWFKCEDYPNAKCETEDVFKITKLPAKYLK